MAGLPKSLTWAAITAISRRGFFVYLAALLMRSFHLAGVLGYKVSHLLIGWWPQNCVICMWSWELGTHGMTRAQLLISNTFTEGYDRNLLFDFLSLYWIKAKSWFFLTGLELRGRHNNIPSNLHCCLGASVFAATSGSHYFHWGTAYYFRLIG